MSNKAKFVRKVARFSEPANVFLGKDFGTVQKSELVAMPALLGGLS